MTPLERIIQQLHGAISDMAQRVRRLETREMPLSVAGSGALYAAAVAGVAVTLLAAGAVQYVLTVVYAVRAIGAGDENGGVVTLAPGDSFALYNDGTDVLTLALSAGGELTVQRTAGAETFDIKLLGVWL